MITSKPHVQMTRFSLASLIVLSSLSLSSCQDEDYGFTTDEVRASVYKRNFEGTYGKIAADQTWDFSSYNLRKLGLTGGPSSGTRAALTRAAIDGLVTKYESNATTWYTVSDKTTAWLNQNLKEKENNTKYVSSFNWEKVKDSDPLYIIPIYQGQTGMIWDLELVDLDNHTSSIIWSKSENFQYVQRYAQWDEFFYESWKADEAPQTSFTNQYGKPDNKLQTLLFSKPLEGLPTNYSGQVIAAFSVGRISEKEGLDVAGSFYIKLNPDGNEYTEITSTNCSTFFNDEDNKKMVESDGFFHFKTAGNVELNPPTDTYPYRTLKTLNPNKVNIGSNILLGSSITKDGVSTPVTVDMLKTLKFEIEDSSYKLTYGSDQKLDNKFGFNTWSPERIHVFVKYNDVEDVTINLQQAATNQYTEHHTINRYKVETRPIKIDLQKLVRNNDTNLPVNFALNLKTKYRGSGDSELSDIGDDHRSDKGFMSQINHFADADKPIDETSLIGGLNSFGIHDLDDGFEYMVIGCEDAGANGKKSDNDYNDLVLLVVGKTLPTQTIRKRYMIEDLGSTLDFDFNDIVVDVTEHVTNTAGGKKYTQTAAIRHLRGTIPFRVTIGTEGKFGTDSNKGKIMRGHNTGDITYDPSLEEGIKADYKWEYTVTLTGNKEQKNAQLAALRSNYWNPDANNIYVEVWPSYNSENGQLSDVFWTGADASKEDNSNATGNNVQNRQIVEFPKMGKVPYIIAVDPTVMWMAENISIPEYWIETRPEHFNNGFDQSDQTQDNVPAVPGIPDGGNKLNNTTSLPAGNFALSNTSTDITASNSLNIPASAFNDVYVGDEIIIHVDGDKVYDKSRLDFKPTTEAIKKIGADGSVVVTGDYAIKVTQSLLDDLQTYGLEIGGQYVTVSKVDVKTAGNSSKINNTNPISGGFAIENSGKKFTDKSWSETLSIPRANFSKLSVGDKIVVHVDNLRGNGSANSGLGMHITSPWGNVPGYASNGGDNKYNVDSDIELLITEDNLSKIKDGGLTLQGAYINVTGVSIIPSSTYSLSLAVMPSNAGTISVDGKSVGSSYNATSYGTTKLVASEPADGYEFVAWAGDVPSTNRTVSFDNTRTFDDGAWNAWAYYGKVIFSDLSIEHNTDGAYNIFRVAGKGDSNQEVRYNALTSALSGTNTQLLIYFTDSDASGTIKLCSAGNGKGYVNEENTGWGWTDLPSGNGKDQTKYPNDNTKANSISVANGLARYKLTSEDVTQIKNEKFYGLTITTNKDNSLVISKILVISSYY